MKEPVVHLNLLQKQAPDRRMAPAFIAVLALTLLALGWHGVLQWRSASEVMTQRDELEWQVRDVRARIAVLSGEHERNAAALALRKEIDELRPRVQAAQAFSDAVRQAASGRSEDFGRALGALAATSEPGLWLTGLNVMAGGRKLEVRGVARDGAAALRFARTLNDALKPMSLRLDQLDVQPAGTDAAAGLGAGAPAPVVFLLS